MIAESGTIDQLKECLFTVLWYHRYEGCGHTVICKLERHDDYSWFSSHPHYCWCQDMGADNWLDHCLHYTQKYEMSYAM